jgi:tight adherence protein B
MIEATMLPWSVTVPGFLAVAVGCIAVTVALRHHGARYRQQFAEGVGAELRQSFYFLSPGLLFRAKVAVVGVLGAMAYLLGGAPAMLLTVLAGGALVPVGLAMLRARRMRLLSRQLPDAVMLVAGGLRAGSSLSQALSQATSELQPPMAREFALALREQKLGVTIDASMANLDHRLKLPEATLFVAAVRVAQESGGNLAETLERLVTSLRRKQEIEGKIDALTSQGRLQGWVMALLPIGICAALFAIEPVAMQPLLTTWYGWTVCAVVLVLESAGLYFIQRIVKIDV